jgi:hypothetical protein
MDEDMEHISDEETPIVKMVFAETEGDEDCYMPGSNTPMLFQNFEK